MHDEAVDALELIVDEGRPASAARFFQLGHDLLAMLDELSELPVAWRVDHLRSGSAVARLVAPDDAEAESRWLGETVSALRQVQGGGALPEAWSPDATRSAHRLVEHGLPEDNETWWVPPRLLLLDDRFHKRTDEVVLTAELGGRLADLQPFERRMPGAVRGTLVGLNVSRGNRASLRLPNRRVVRVSFDTSLRADLKDALYQEVELRGQVRQDGDGRVFHVRAEDASMLKRPQSRWADLWGIDPGFTGDLDAGTWLEANRGEA